MDPGIDGIRISEAPRNLMEVCNDISSKWYKHNQYQMSISIALKQKAG